MLSGVHVGSTTGDLLVLASTSAQALQIVMVERYANRYDAIALTLVEMATCFLGFLVIALALGDLSVPRGWTVWGALIVTGVFASAFAFLIQIWAQRRMQRRPDRARLRARDGLRRVLRLLSSTATGSAGSAGAAAPPSSRGSWSRSPLRRGAAASCPTAPKGLAILATMRLRFP